MIELRDLQADDVEHTFRWRSEPEVDRWMYGAPPSREEHGRWFDNFMVDPDVKGWIILQDGKASGSLTLVGLTNKLRRAKWGWYIGDADARGRGAGRAAQALGLDLAFRDFDLQKVWSEVLADNDTALRAQAAAGFRREGYLRRHAYKHGAYRDVALLAILKEEWEARREAVVKNLRASGLIAG